jgi:hypothetical protein
MIYHDFMAPMYTEFDKTMVPMSLFTEKAFRSLQKSNKFHTSLTYGPRQYKLTSFASSFLAIADTALGTYDHLNKNQPILTKTSPRKRKKLNIF